MSEDSFEIRSGRRGAALVGGLALAYATFAPAAISPDGPWATALARGGDAITSIIPMADTAIGTILAGGGFTAAIVAAGAWVGAKTYSSIRRHWTDLDDDERSTIRDARETRAYGAAADRIAGSQHEGTAYFEVEEGAIRELNKQEFKRRAAEVRSSDRAVEVRDEDEPVAISYRSGVVQAVHRGRRILAGAALAVGLAAPALQQAQADEIMYLDPVPDAVWSADEMAELDREFSWLEGMVESQDYAAAPATAAGSRSPEETLQRRLGALIGDADAASEVAEMIRRKAPESTNEEIVSDALVGLSVAGKMEDRDGEKMRQGIDVIVDGYRVSSDTPEPKTLDDAYEQLFGEGSSLRYTPG